MVRGPLVMLGYYGNKQATEAAIAPGDWLHTGDIATRDDEGHYFIVDRFDLGLVEAAAAVVGGSC